MVSHRECVSDLPGVDLADVVRHRNRRRCQVHTTYGDGACAIHSVFGDVKNGQVVEEGARLSFLKILEPLQTYSWRTCTMHHCLDICSKFCGINY